jgi:hypothetical protein
MNFTSHGISSLPAYETQQHLKITYNCPRMILEQIWGHSDVRHSAFLHMELQNFVAMNTFLSFPCYSLQ